jgi:plastocyanin
MRRSRIAGTAAALSLAAVPASLAAVPASLGAPAVTTVNGTVGPDFVINLTSAGKKVKTLEAGVPYRFVVSDRSSIHDFHLTGPGLDKEITTVGFTGTKSVVLKLKKGSYTYFCDPHRDSMLGGFNVGPGHPS